FLDKYADTEFKVILLQNAMQIAQQKRDTPLTLTYAERLLEADPKNFEADIAIASSTAQGAKEFDLDKAEKTAKVQKYAQAGLDSMKDYPKPMSQIPDDQWAAQKKSAAAQAYASLGMMDMINKKYDDAIKDYQTALDTSPDPITTFRLGEAYMKANKLDEADAAFDKVVAAPSAPPQVKTFAQQRKADVAKLKAAKK
ncbi:MAG: tetratricopeptide repeat protein, partial [Acidobacteriaceae bacterium]|nr:tetratricopeptide repeat protein [Acidobacteriaceae bacterium]